MELTCALVLTFVSLVTATPHGYGVKGVAVAKADASAVAGGYGGFGEVPLSIPNGAGFSGSYSKSSSSSFASSSASSSASSFSYSGSGPAVLGANGVSAVGANGVAAPSSGGCTPGNCQSIGSNGIQDSRGAGSTGNVQTYGGAKAAAAAGAAAVAGSPVYSKTANQPCTGGDCSNRTPSSCDGPNCDDLSSTDKKCISGQCSPTSSTFSSPPDYESNNKCTSGNCEQPSQSGSTSTGKDIPIFVALGPKPTSELPRTSGQSYDKKASAFAGAGTSNSAGTAQVHDKPSTYLTAPKEGPACTSPNCELPTGSAYDKQKLPSSYNVPIHGNYPDSPTHGKGPCTSGNCAYNKPNVPQPSYQVPSGPSGSDSCVTGNCAVKIPSYSQGASPAFLPTGSANCGSANCAGIPSSSSSVVPSSPNKYPSYSELPSNAPIANAGALAGASAISESFGATKPILPANQKLPAYTGGFGGPQGILKPNEYNNPPSTLPTSGYKPPTTANIHNPAPCSSGNCGSGLSQSIPQYGQGKPTAPGVIYNTPSCSYGNCGQPGQISPHYDHSGSTKPTQPTGGFGGPAGILKPNDFNTSPINTPVYNQKPAPVGVISPSSCTSGTCGPQSSITSPQYDLSSSPSGNQYKPTAPAGTYNPGTCSSGNCGTQPSPLYQPPYSQNSPSKPPAPINEFGGPPGILKPNDFNTHFNVPTSPTSETSNPLPQYKPTASAGTGSSFPCSSGNCGSQPSQPLSPYGQSSFNKPSTPTGTYNPVSCPSGNCGVQPSSPGNIPAAPQVPYNSASCSSGKCGSQSSQPSPQYGQSGTASSVQYKPTASSGTPTSCSSGNCGLQQSPSQYGPTGYSGSSNGAYATSGAVATANAVAYTRGFGGPPGFLKPYDDGKLGNSASSLNNNYHAGSQLNAHHSTASGGDVNSYGKSLNGAGIGALTGSGAQASAIAGASAGAYDSGNNLQGGFNNKAGNYGSDNQIGGACKDGCGSNGGGANFGVNGGFPDGLNGFNTAGAAAKGVASAGVGSFGLGGSFASSSASAHASAGAATKGGYGKR